VVKVRFNIYEQVIRSWPWRFKRSIKKNET